MVAHTPAANDPCERRAARAELVAELFRAAARVTDERELLELAARRIAEVFGDTASILVLSPDREWLDVAASHATDPAQAALIRELAAHRMRSSEGIAGSVLASGRPLLISHGDELPGDPRLKPEYRPFLERFGIRSLLAAPLGLRDEIFGVIDIARTADDRGPFDEEDLAFLGQLTGGGSVFAVMRDRAERDRAVAGHMRQRERDQVVAEFFAAVSQAEDEAAVFRRLTEHVVRVVRVLAAAYTLSPDGRYLDLVSVSSRDPERIEPWIDAIAARRLASDEGAGGHAVQTGEVTFIPSIPEEAREALRARYPRERWTTVAGTEPRALMAVPLYAEGRRIGHIAAARLGADDEPFEEADLDFVKTLASRAALAFDRLAARRALEMETNRTRILAEFLDAASAARDERALLDELATRTAAELDARCIVLGAAPDPQYLELIAVAGDPRSAELRAAYSRRANVPWEGYSGRAFASGEPVFVPQVRTEGSEPPRPVYSPQYAPLYGDTPVTGVIAVPLRVSGRVIGVLTVGRHNGRAFDRPDLDFMLGLAARAAIALDRLRERADRDRDARRAEVVAEFVQSASDASNEQEVLLALAQRASDATAGSLAVYRITPDGRELDAVALTSHDGVADAFRAMYAVQRWRVDEGMMGLALTTRQPVFRPYLTAAEREAYLASLPDDRRRAMHDRDLRAIIAVPLTDGGRQIGILTLARYGPDADPFTERDRAFAEELAARTNIVLARLALAAERDRETRQARALAHFLEGIADASGDEEDLFRRLAETASDEIGDVCVVKLLSAGRTHFEPSALAARDPELVETLRRGLAANRLPADRATEGEVVATGRALLARLDPDVVRARALPGFGPFVAHDFTSQLVAPLFVRGAVIGDIMLLREAPSPAYDERDLSFLEELAGRTSLVVERHRAEQARDAAAAELRQTAATLQTMFEASPLGMQLLDPAGRVLIWSPGAERLFGFSADEVVGRYPPMIPHEDLPAAMEMARRVVGGSVVEGMPARRLRKDGTAIEVLLYGAPIRDESGATRLLTIYADMTERNRLEQELRRTSQTLRTILDSSPLAVIAVDEQMRVMFWNHAAEALYGWTEGDVLGRKPPIEPDESTGLVDSMLERLQAGESVVGEGRRRTRDGSIVEVRTHEAPLRDEEGGFRGSLAVHEDVRERKRLEAELLQAQKMETVGRLAGGVAHDFNNILTAIIGFSDIGRSMTTDGELEEILDTIRSSAERAAGLTQQLLAFSRRQMLQPGVLEANEAVLGMESILRRLIGEDIELSTALTPNVGSILVDRTQLEQVILNLAVNARDAMPGGGRLVLRTEQAHLAGDHAHIEMPAGDYVVISVADTGLGMDEETKRHIFEPFFTTKEVGKGTGLGLATSYGIVRQSGGYIWVYSEPGRGAVFKLYFPRVGAAIPADPAPVRPRPALRGRVLLVEDEPVLRELARIVLSRDGFDVVPAANPSEAFSIVDDTGGEAGGETGFDLLVTDVVMPGMTGIELARRLREASPGLRILLMSGYAEDVTDPAGAMSRRFLAKPFTPESLLRAVDDAMSEEPRPAE